MYYADSDILSIWLTIFTIAAAIYSSFGKPKKKVDTDSCTDSIFKDIVIPEPDKENLSDKQSEEACAVATTQEPAQQQKSSTIENSRQNSLKSRLKNSPKDAVLFAEILKPKYKEF